MSFRMPDLIIESILKDGLNNVRRDESILDDVFEDFTRAYATKKYGPSEIEKIRQIIQNKDVALIHAFSLAPAHTNSISIQLVNDRESVDRAHMGNFVSNITVPITKPDDLAALVKVSSFQPDAYNPLTGVIAIPDSVNLAPVYANLLFVDSTGAEFPILGGIINELGEKQIIIAKGADVSLANGAEIKSSLNFEVYQKHGTVEDQEVLLGIHTKDALLTKYLYILTKYFILSRKKDMISRGFILSTYTGSDFTRDLQYEGDVVYTRFLSLTGTVQHQWRSDKTQLIDSVNVNLKIPKDRLGNEALNREDQTIQVKEP